MANPLFDMLGGMGGGMPGMGGMGGNNPMAMIQEFQKFQQQMQGKNPQEEVQKLLQSGQISQEQLNHAQQMAKQLQGVMGMFK